MFKQLLAPLVAPLLALVLAAPGFAQTKAGDGPANSTNGEIRKVDKDAKKVTIKHGEIKHLDMPPMTMVFQVKDAALLDKVKAGDKISFAVEKGDGGAFLVTDIQPAKP
jgi:Cu/Ag efflux protein CusF